MIHGPRAVGGLIHGSIATAEQRRSRERNERVKKKSPRARERDIKGGGSGNASRLPASHPISRERKRQSEAPKRPARTPTQKMLRLSTSIVAWGGRKEEEDHCMRKPLDSLRRSKGEQKTPASAVQAFSLNRSSTRSVWLVERGGCSHENVCACAVPCGVVPCHAQSIIARPNSEEEYVQVMRKDCDRIHAVVIVIAMPRSRPSECRMIWSVGR